MAIYDHEAVRKAYPNAVSIGDNRGVFDIDEKEITIDDSLVTAARAEIDKALSDTLYQRQRTGEAGTTDTIYLPLAQQLDMQYWDSVNGTTTWKDHVAAVKAKYPKPS
jgi:hypothetical protein|tara:strand:+ start:289 stop:612 length:324 start_codon:yes stop_codon:yes gene_type:complete